MCRKIPNRTKSGDNSWIWTKILFYPFCLKIFKIFRKLTTFRSNTEL